MSFQGKDFPKFHSLIRTKLLIIAIRLLSFGRETLKDYIVLKKKQIATSNEADFVELSIHDWDKERCIVTSRTLKALLTFMSTLQIHVNTNKL